MPPLPEERWRILAGIPKVVPNEEAKGGRPRVNCSILNAGDEAPCASVLTVPTRVSSGPTDLWYPYVAAADPSGMILLCATQPLTNFSRVVSYYLCDAPTGKVVPIPRHWQIMGLHGHNVGLLRRGRDFMVAELRPDGDGSGRATLLCFTAGKYDWVEKKLTYLPPLDRHYFGEGVISHGGMLWWVDLSYGILACDPFADAPELLYIPLPSVPDELPARPVDRGVYRCVKVCGGRLRHVQIHGSFNAPLVTMWALADPARAGDWVRERSVPLADVWADESYLNTKLPQRIPALALLHPTDPDMVYFFLRSCIFAVDLRLRKVVEFNDFWMPEPPPHLKPSSHFVHIWQNDPSERPDVLPSCFNRDKFLGPDVKLMKRFAAAKSRSTAPTVKPVVHKDISLKRTSDQAKIKREQLQAKKMKLYAVFSEIRESLENLPASSRIKREQLQAKKMKLYAVFSEIRESLENLPASSRIKEGAVGAVGV